MEKKGNVRALRSAILLNGRVYFSKSISSSKAFPAFLKYFILVPNEALPYLFGYIRYTGPLEWSLLSCESHFEQLPCFIVTTWSHPHGTGAIQSVILLDEVRRWHGDVTISTSSNKSVCVPHLAVAMLLLASSCPCEDPANKPNGRCLRHQEVGKEEDLGFGISYDIGIRQLSAPLCSTARDPNESRYQ